MRLTAALGCATLVLSFAPSALAHSLFVDPPPLIQDDNAKSGPCGCYFGSQETPGEDSTPAECPSSFDTTEYEPGAEIVVQWKETVNHNGDFRISFSSKPPSEVVKADFEGGILYEEPDTNPDSGATLTATITLPEMSCDDCTLQLRQYMETTYYYSCASIRLVAGAQGSTATTGAGATSGSGSGGETGSGSSGDGGGSATGANATSAGAGASGQGGSPSLAGAGGGLDSSGPGAATPPNEGGSEDGCSVGGHASTDAAIPLLLAGLVLARRKRR